MYPAASLNLFISYNSVSCVKSLKFSIQKIVSSAKVLLSGFSYLAQINFYQNGLQVRTSQPKVTSQGDLLVNPPGRSRQVSMAEAHHFFSEKLLPSASRVHDVCAHLGSHTRNANEPRCDHPHGSTGSGNAPHLSAPTCLLSPSRPLNSKCIKETTKLAPPGL